MTENTLAYLSSSQRSLSPYSSKAEAEQEGLSLMRLDTEQPPRTDGEDFYLLFMSGIGYEKPVQSC